MRVAIAGAGITGLAAAYYLRQAGADVILVEKESRLGGVIRTSRVHGCIIECGPDSFLAAKPAALELIRELGLESDVIGSNDHGRVTYILKRGRLLPLPEGLMMVAPSRVRPMLSTRLLGWRTKIGMAAEYFRRPPGASADRSVSQFLGGHYGQEMVDYLGEPLLAGVYGGDPEKLSATAVLGRFLEMEQRYGSLTRGALAARQTARGAGGPLFRTLRQGLGSLIEAIEARLRAQVQLVGGEVETAAQVDGAWRLRVNGSWLDADGLIVACPAWAASKILRQSNPELASLLDTIPYHHAMTVALGYRRADCAHLPPGFGFLVPKRERDRLLACTFVHNKFSGRTPDDLALLRCFFGADLMAESDETVIRHTCEEIARILNHRAEPLFAEVSRWPRAMAQYTVGHLDRLAEIDRLAAQIPGLRLAGNAYRGIGLPDCIASARDAVRTLTAAAAPATPPA
jgi:oxygen-dependent protoporphyrinogen oxidase